MTCSTEVYYQKMIAYLSGVVESKNIDSVVLEVHGVGYGLRVTATDAANLVSGETAKLQVYEHIREDQYDLFGFTKESTKTLFQQLLGVKNVGPKVALAILDIGSESSVRSAIAGGEIKLLQAAKGVGKRAAEQIIVELRDKVGLQATVDAEGVVARSAVDVNDEATQALVALGYSEADAQTALATIDPELNVEQRIKLALKRRT